MRAGPMFRGGGSDVTTRAMGLDLGERRIGVSVSDSGRVLATPHSVLIRTGEPVEDRRAIANLATELGAGVVVVGLPITLAGDRGPAAKAAAAEAAALAAELDVPVVLHDERLTTVEAGRRRSLGDRPRATGGGGPRRQGGRPHATLRRRGIDAVAATVLLQAWLDQDRAEP